MPFFRLQIHPLDSAKYGKIVRALHDKGLAKDTQLVAPLEAPLEVLLAVHTEKYLKDIHTRSWTVAQVTELQPLVAVPNWVLQWRVVTPMKFHVGGTMVAAALAIQYGWAINIGGERDTAIEDASKNILCIRIDVRPPAVWILSGGMHHAYSSTGMGWCPFADITLAVLRLRQASGGAVRKARDNICMGERDRINTLILLPAVCFHCPSLSVSLYILMNH